MKRFSKFLIMAMFLGISVLLSSCSKVDGQTNKLIGTWDLVAQYNLSNMHESEAVKKGTETWVVVFTETEVTFNYSIDGNKSSETQKYTIENNALWFGSLKAYTIVELTDNSLVLDNSTYRCSFKRR